MSRKNKLEEWEDVQIAFDKKNSLYVAYSTETNVVATGICVSSAKEAYVHAYNQRQAEMAEGFAYIA